MALAGANAPAIVIQRGGTIYALGTAEQPITFTAIDGHTASTSLVSTDSRVSTEIVTGRRGKWGGLVLLGRAPVNAPGGTSAVEGLRGPHHGGSDPGYGGNNPHDSSGELRFVRVWHAGAVVSQDEEINGLTLAGVGDGTIIDHVEVRATARAPTVADACVRSASDQPVALWTPL